ncbi:MAG: hypothetical protein QHJ73_16400, partial [Armatimonadota bacterium]|nr:hypothetical protein [Armatimonadota bacterium]
MVLLLCATAAAAVPLLDNGGFEEGDPSAGWDLSLSGGFVSVDRSTAAEGKRSLRYANSQLEKGGPWPVTHVVSIPARGMLAVRGQVRVAGFRGSVEAALYTPNLLGDVQLAGRRVLISALDSPLTTEWQPFTFACAPAPGGGVGTLRLSFSGTGRAWVDALEVFATGPGDGPTPTPPWPSPRPLPPSLPPGDGENLLRDTGFEGSEHGGPWRRFWNPRRAFGIVCLFDTQNAYQGSRSALVTNRSPFSRDAAGWCQDVLGVSPGSQLVLTGHARTENVEGSAYLRLECWGRRPNEVANPEAPEELLAAATSEAVWLNGSNAWTPVAV